VKSTKRIHRSDGVSLLLAGAIFFIGTAQAREVFDDHLTGDWGGKRTAWLEQGVSIEAFNTTDLFRGVQGGLSDGSAVSNEFELVTTADLAALFGWPGARLYLHTAGSGGREPADLSGSIHEPSDLVDDDALQVLEFWFEQSFFQQRLSLLAGLFEVDSEFDVRDTADMFLNSGFGFGLELPDIETDGPSISTLSGLGLRARFELSPQFGVSAAVIEGVSGELDDGDGRFWIGEADWQPDGFEFLRLGLGGWRYDGRFQRLDESGPAGSTSGAYAFVEGVLFNEAGALDQGLSGFVRVGRADQRINRFGRHQAAGLVYTGLIPGRDEDALGLALSSIDNGDDFVGLLSRDGERTQRRETVIELTYYGKLLPGLSVQPSIQYTLNPDADPDIDDHFGVGLRIGITF
jgi:porin